MKILITDPIDEEGIKILENEFDVDIKENLTEDEIISIIENYDAMIVRSATKVTAKIIEAGKNLKVIGRAGTGVDNIDIDAATNHNIAVINAPRGNVIAVAELVFGMMITLARNLIKGNNSLKNKQWIKKELKGIELAGKTLGIIGLGRIGREVAKRATAFDMKVIAYDPFVKEFPNVEIVEFDELLKRSDFITIHVPLTKETENMISFDEFEKMKSTAILINCARGGVVDEEALYDALINGKISGAGLDVFVNEPPFSGESAKLLELENVMLTPHIGAATKEAQKKCGIEIAQQVRKFLKTGTAENIINFK